MRTLGISARALQFSHQFLCAGPSRQAVSGQRWISVTRSRSLSRTSEFNSSGSQSRSGLRCEAWTCSLIIGFSISQADVLIFYQPSKWSCEHQTWRSRPWRYPTPSTRTHGEEWLFAPHGVVSTRGRFLSACP
ncbi:hypothetical protein PYCCODRAFT_792128 [Trametes coccinea BRFM310]|uniref:Uncharacterized protein n=1 Tax=Trametes coccinea (strain BRFM310) TaxID=1353009 RepID=A0A1Y2J0Y3_TRAC3|nr:hypothetical protein PYCCODRAFT_792128 [Trametes coccinea BRFM310]